MKLTHKDRRWLLIHLPDLLHDTKANLLVGELGLCASYDATSRRLSIGEDADQNHPSFVSDAFAIEVELNSIGPEGWPKVRETGGRRQDIAEREGVDAIDLHFYSDGSCCLGLRLYPERRLTIDGLMTRLVVPFFYRLSYTDKHGLEAGRRDLWGEYSHGEAGFDEYLRELLRMSRQSPGRNDRCPCGSGQKYKRCHVDEVTAFRLRRTLPG